MSTRTLRGLGMSFVLAAGCTSQQVVPGDLAVGGEDMAIAIVSDAGNPDLSGGGPTDPDLSLNEPMSYCGSSLDGGEPNTLYRIKDGVTISKTKCEFGCMPAPSSAQTMGLESRDYCALRLPFPCGTSVDCTQSNFGEGCGATYGHQYWPEQFAWDFGKVTRGVTQIAAARSGTIVALYPDSPPGKTYASDGGAYECYNGCDTNSSNDGGSTFGDCCKTCLSHSNHVKVAHGDGTVTVYVHLDSIDPRWNVGDSINAGEVLGVAGTSGCSTGPHLHFQSMRDTNDRRPNGTLRTYDCKASRYECTSLPASFVDVSTNMGNPPCDVSSANLSPTSASGCP